MRSTGRTSRLHSRAIALALACGAAACQGGAGASDAAAPDAGDGAASNADAADAQAVPFAPLAPGVYATKVKNLLVGLPLTDAEYQSITADPTTLGALIDAWMALPQWRDRVLLFFGHAFQQNQAVFNDYLGLGMVTGDTFNGNYVGFAAMLAATQDTFPRTALELIDEHRPFTEVVTTNRYMMSTGVMMLWSWLDTLQKDDNMQPQAATLRVLRQFPGLTAVMQPTPVPIAQSIDPTSANYMHWQYPGTTTPTTERSYTLLTRIQGSIVQTQLTAADWNDWRMVTVRPPATPAEPMALYWDLPTMRQLATTELVLQTPRIGFFSTPAFTANWSTNASNQARVTANQTMIVALGTAFDDTGVTVQVTSSAGDAMHAQPGTVCYACHQTLDPMRDFFRETFTYTYGLRVDGAAAMIPPTASFSVLGSAPITGSGTGDLARATAADPHFAAAWTQKLCEYANSVPCDPTDPEFIRVAGVFQSSGFDFRRLMRELFASPLVTYASPTQSTRANPSGGVGISRRDGFCYGLSQRLGLGDLCNLSGVGSAGQRALGNIALSIPGDGYARGVAAPLTPTDPNLFFVAATEQICTDLAPALVDAVSGPSLYTSANKDAALDAFVATVMGVPPSDPRSAPLRAELAATYDEALAQPGQSATTALQSTFILACASPTSVSSGM